jgi:hypothetical protein
VPWTPATRSGLLPRALALCPARLLVPPGTVRSPVAGIAGRGSSTVRGAEGFPVGGSCGLRGAWWRFPLPLLESRARVLVLAARSPVLRPPLCGPLQIFSRPLRLLRRIPQPAAREPLHHDIAVLPPKLIQRGQQLFLVTRAERGRFVVDEDGPVRVAGRHYAIVQIIVNVKPAPLTSAAVSASRRASCASG